MKIAMTLLLTIIAYGTTVLAADSAESLLQASDRARGSLTDGLQWNAQIETSENGESSQREFLIKAKKDDAFVEASAPAKYKGEVYLFNDRNMWFFKPSLKKPVSISPRQKLVGQAANGDIASTHYARDYSATIEKVEGDYAVLMLSAKSKNLTYDKIRYWVNQKTKLAEKAEFLTLQGKAFKVGLLKYENTLKVDGKMIPFISELTISDAKFPQNKSVIKYKTPQVVNVNSSLFDINNLTR